MKYWKSVSISPRAYSSRKMSKATPLSPVSFRAFLLKRRNRRARFSFYLIFVQSVKICYFGWEKLIPLGVLPTFTVVLTLLVLLSITLTVSSYMLVTKIYLLSVLTTSPWAPLPVYMVATTWRVAKSILLANIVFPSLVAHVNNFTRE